MPERLNVPSMSYELSAMSFYCPAPGTASHYLFNQIKTLVAINFAACILWKALNYFYLTGYFMLWEPFGTMF
jgi:hypothetical protein